MNPHCRPVTPFLSISSPFSASVQSGTFLLASLQHLMSSSQRGHASSSLHVVTHELPPLGEVGAVSPLQAGAAPAILREVSILPFLEEGDASEEVHLIDVPVIMAANSTSTAQVASLHDPRAPTLPSTPVAHRASTRPVEMYALEEQQERSALENNQASRFETILAREVSDYLRISYHQRMAARQPTEYIGGNAPLNMEKEARRLHDSMRARMKAAEAEHQKFMSIYRPVEQVQLSTTDERTPRSQPMLSLENQAEVKLATRRISCGTPHLLSSTSSFDGLFSVNAPPRQLSLDTRRMAPSEAQKGNNPGVRSEIQRQLRLGRPVVHNAGEWTADPLFTVLR
ncbi:conserved hypothetical protein [Leishmania braziliensis MHOM/BR/75/M2904]|uniref:Uncharacterized protein n=1 Tax=Leishmania braziliensis TaxID=5660 RepID=A4HNY2_LEIBR|nr:conserved hypothetical protein [Leishmania braziliensis MHOM/BR/75/M2904]CAJ2481286.1 unnamed protein product [Leishmania braziliensis]CAM43887.1 conserved hypothetical protein [Leishmania braziliensis MHOM/BR/75/M2904]